MNVIDIQDEIAAACATIDGLRAYPYTAQAVTPPAALVGWPGSIVYDETMGRGADSLSLPLFVLVGHIDARNTRERLAHYLDGGGPQSVKAAIDRFRFTSCDSCRISSGKVEVVAVADVEYLGATFVVDIFGKGAGPWHYTQS